MKELAVDICVIGAGAAGLTTAAIAAQLGARTVLIERAEMGGECLQPGACRRRRCWPRPRRRTVCARAAGSG